MGFNRNESCRGHNYYSPENRFGRSGAGVGGFRSRSGVGAGRFRSRSDRRWGADRFSRSERRSVSRSLSRDYRR